MAAVERHENAEQVFATWQPYTLKPGETLDTRGAARRRPDRRAAQGQQPSRRSAHRCRHAHPGAAGQRRGRDPKVEQFVAPRVYEQVERPRVYHTVGRAESAPTIAQRYGISTATLAAWNGIKRGVKRGMRLLVQPASTQTLLTNEEGERSVVNTAQHSTAMMKVVASEPAQKEPDPAPQAPAPRRAACRPRLRSRSPSRRRADELPGPRCRPVRHPAGARSATIRWKPSGKLHRRAARGCRRCSSRPTPRASPPGRSARPPVPIGRLPRCAVRYAPARISASAGAELRGSAPSSG